jgi:hypothetical protein
MKFFHWLFGISSLALLLRSIDSDAHCALDGCVYVSQHLVTIQGQSAAAIFDGLYTYHVLSLAFRKQTHWWVMRFPTGERFGACWIGKY